MPVYEYRCDKCDREVTLTLTISEHEKGPVKCPKCGSKALRPLLSTFLTQTAKKS
jgi:putative FmdB family regulatory protein